MSNTELLLREMRYIAGISTGQVKRVAEQALEAVKQAQPERDTCEHNYLISPSYGGKLCSKCGKPERNK